MFKSSKNTTLKDSNEVIKNVNKKTTIPSIINAELAIKGDLISDNIIEVFGKVDGNIICDVLSIREGAVIIGKINAKYTKISGSFTGEIKSAIIHVSGTGNLSGKIEYGIISTEEKATVEGSLKHNQALLETKALEGDLILEQSPSSAPDDESGILQFKKKKAANE